MKIFISWSGQRSKLVAELFKSWLQHVIQAVEPWLSTKDIDRGSIWFSEINNQLANTNNGIICLTKSNINKPWILFESGALAKGLTHNRVYTFLIDLEPNEINDPLSQFNHTLPTKESLFQLLKDINSGLDKNSLNDTILQSVFETFYPDFHTRFKDILEITSEQEPKLPIDEKEYVNEILYTVRAIDKRVRKLEETEDANPRHAKMISTKYLNLESKFDPINTSIAELDLSVRAYETLKARSIFTVSDLMKFEGKFLEEGKLKTEIMNCIEDCKILYG